MDDKQELDVVMKWFIKLHNKAHLKIDSVIRDATNRITGTYGTDVFQSLDTCQHLQAFQRP